MNQGLILGEAEYIVFKTEGGELVSLEHVDAAWETRTVGEDATGAGGKLQTISKDVREWGVGGGACD